MSAPVRTHALYRRCLPPAALAVLAVLAATAAGCGEDEQAPASPPPPPAKPVIARHKMETYFFAENKANIWVANEGRDGWVRLSYRTTDTRTSTKIKRRSGAEVWVRHNFTEGDDSEYYLESNSRTVLTGSWACYVFVKAGQTRHVQLDLPGHSRSHDQQGPFAAAVHEPPTGGDVK